MHAVSVRILDREGAGMSETTTGVGVGTRGAGARPATYAAGAACVVGATVLTVGGVATQAVAAGTSVPPQVWHHPWASGTFILVTVVLAVAQGLLVVGVMGLRSSGAAGTAGPPRPAWRLPWRARRRSWSAISPRSRCAT